MSLDTMDAATIVRLMDDEERQTMKAVADAAPEIAKAVERAAEAFRRGGRIVYVGAGTSGRIATLDAAEMPPTFGTDPSRFVALMAGGSTAGITAVENAEDGTGTAVAALEELGIRANDVLFGIAASGTTPYVIAAIKHARSNGVWTCGIANNPNTAVLQEADLGIFLDTGPEILTGSTRLKAGTSQKLVLNRISTAAMVLNGKVVENLMIDVKAKNAKLKDRCARIVVELSDALYDEAKAALEANEWSIRAALAEVKE